MGVEFEFPDGIVYEFPDGTTEQEAIDYYKKNIAIEESSVPVDLARSVAQGFGFGFGDEAIALARSAFGDETYEEALRQERGTLERFRKESPYLAYGTEIASSIPMTLLGVGALGRGAQLGGKAAAQVGSKLAAAAPSQVKSLAVTQAGKIAAATPSQVKSFAAPASSLLGQTASGAALGGLYGAGAATEGERVGGAETGAILGGLLSGASGVILPKVTQQAQKLLDAGVPLTVGQATGGVVGGVERALSSIPLVGDVIQKAQQRATQGFNRAVIDSALKPINIKLPKGATGQEAFDIARKAVSDAYDEVIPKLKIDDAESLRTSMQSAIQNAADDFGLWQGAGLEGLNAAVKEASAILPLTGKVSGDFIKRIESRLGNMAKNAYGSGNYSVGGAIRDVQAAFRRELARQDKSGAAGLKAANQAFARLYPIEKAVNKAIASGGDFTPSQLLSAMRANAPRQTARGSAFGQDFAQSAQEVMSNVAGGGTLATPLTGVYAIGQAAQGRLGPAQQIAGLLAGASPLYSRIGVPVTRGVITGSGETVRSIAPSISGLLSQKYQ